MLKCDFRRRLKVAVQSVVLRNSKGLFQTDGRSSQRHRMLSLQTWSLYSWHVSQRSWRYEFRLSVPILYDSVYVTCSKKMTGSQLSPPHETNKKLKCETKNKMVSVIGPVQSRYHAGKRNLRWEGFVEKVGFEV